MLGAVEFGLVFSRNERVVDALDAKPNRRHFPFYVLSGRLNESSERSTAAMAYQQWFLGAGNDLVFHAALCRDCHMDIVIGLVEYLEVIFVPY